MGPLESARKGGHRSPRVFRSDQTGRNQRPNRADAVGTWKSRIFYPFLNVVGPVHAGMLCTERVSDVEAVEVKSYQVAKSRGLDPVQRVDVFFAIVQDRGVDQFRFNYADVDSWIARGGIPDSRAHSIRLRGFQRNAEILGRHERFRVFLVNPSGKGNRARRVFSFGSDISLSFRTHSACLAVAVL